MTMNIDEREPQRIRDIPLQIKVMSEATKILEDAKLDSRFSYRLAFWLGYRYHRDQIQKLYTKDTE